VTVRDGEGVRHTELDSGLRVVTEVMPELRSVCVGFWAGTGSRDESGDLSGASHFLEHLLFKGTDTRTAREIAESVEAVGGEMNAFTTKEYTAYYVRILDEGLDLALDILSDVIWRPAFRSDEVDSERQVILEEIHMRDDTPDDLVHDLFADALFPEHPLGREILGTADSIERMPRDDIAGYHHRHYRGGNIVVAAAGNLSHDAIVEGVARRFEGEGGGRETRELFDHEAPSTVRVLHRSTEQAHLVLGMPALSRTDPDRYALSVLNQVLGGGMASRLFQEVREKRGLAYSVYSYRMAFVETGLLAVYAGTAPGRADEVLAIVNAELDRIVDDGGISDDELLRAKGHLKGSLALSLEDSSGRMNRLGRSELTTGEVQSVDDVVAQIDVVTDDDIRRVIERVLAPRHRVLAVVGPFEEGAFEARVA
jgi:predicted Zn-dependent peptidase